MKLSQKKKESIIFFNSLLCSLLILTYFFSYHNLAITKFDDRIIGNMVLNNINSIGFINFFILSLFLIFPLLLFICYKILTNLYKNSTTDIFEFNKKISIFGLLSYFFGFFGFLNNYSRYSTFFLAIIFCIITILNLILYRYNTKLESKYIQIFEYTTLISIPLTTLCSLFIHNLRLFNFNNHLIFIIIYMLSICITFLLSKKLNFNKLIRSSIIFLISIIIHPLYLELYNILNQHNIIIPHKSFVLLLIYLLLLIISLIYYKYFSKSKYLDYKKYFYVIIIIGISSLYATNAMTTTIDTDFFESANNGVSIYELFKYKKIPIIENFDAHLLSSEILGIIYGLLNHDYFGAIFNIYNSYQIIILYLVMYFLINYFLGKDYAFLCVLTIPFIKDTSLNYMCFGLISVFAFLNATNKNTFQSFLLFWLCLAITCIWRLDLGFSISFSCIFLLIYLLILNRKNKNQYNIKFILFSLLVVIITFILIYLSICLMKNINPIYRLIEFLKISLSNNNWAYSSIGNATTYSYYLYYYILPILTIISLLYLLSIKKYNNQLLILIILGLFYVFNFSRGLIRHSLFENTLMRMLSYSLIYFSFFISYKTKYTQKATPILIYSILLIVSSLTINSTFDNYDSLIIETANKNLDYHLEDQINDTKVQRLTLSDNMSAEIRELGKVLSLLLKKDETYLDFSNQTLLYSLLGYEKPVYVNQSPGLLSGEYSQQQFINEIKNFKGEIPVAIKARNKLLSNNLDGVDNDFRYYLISEYIYNNYILLTNINDYEIWVKSDYYDKAKLILNENNIQTYNDININYHKDTEIDLKYIPYIWGKENINTKTIEKLNITASNNIFNIYRNEKNKINKNKGNYLILNIENPSEEVNVTLNVMSKNRIVDKIKFYIPSGINKYKLRISSLYSWYFNDVDEVELLSNSKIKIKNGYICQGDVLKDIKY